MIISPAYLAGFLDGEGSIMLMRNSQRGTYHVKVTLANTHLPVLQQIQAEYGGRLVQAFPAKQGWKVGFRLEWSSAAAIPIIEMVFPWLVVKRPQAELALAFQRQLRGRKSQVRSVVEKEHEGAMRAEMQGLNKRGVAA